MAAGPNPTGMPWSRIERVDGRTGDILRLPGRSGEVRLHSHRLRAPFAKLLDVVQYQFEFDGERLSVAVVPRAGAPREVVDRVRAALATVLDEAGAAGVRVEARAVDAIAREPGGAAKLKQVKLTRPV